jgi:phospholipid/cholesterol/gamma-HCH transport system substrate-binding protein
MAKSTGNNIKLGILVFISAFCLISAIIFIGNRQQLFHSTFRISGIFKDISGLQVGNNIRFSGLNVGIVEDIEQITDTTVLVEMVIDAHTQRFIKKNAKAIIGSEGLMGNKIIIITPGSPGSPAIANKDVIATAMPINMDDIMATIKVTSANSASISSDLAVIIRDIRLGKGTIGKLFTDSIMAENVSEAMVNIKQGAGGFKKNMDAASHNVLLKGFLKKKEEKKERPK